MRPRVEYGINERGLKRLAVPYRAADTPSERAEYGHPDVALCCTVLSYYYDGLSATQTMEAFTQLLEQGPSAQVRDQSMPHNIILALCVAYHLLACLRVYCVRLRAYATNHYGMQEDLYDSWFALSQPLMEQGHAEALDNVRKLDLSNAVQAELLATYFRRNMETVNFWLAQVTTQWH
jgi:hypothetical protein